MASQIFAGTSPWRWLFEGISTLGVDSRARFFPAPRGAGVGDADRACGVDGDVGVVGGDVDASRI
jgi:hypothetical protein